jgi:hypothetical protein
VNRLKNPRVQVALLVAVATIPLLLQAIHLLTTQQHYIGNADNAMNEMMVQSVGHHPVLLGPFSRDGWTHPGPALFYLAALPYHLLGGDSTAMLLVALGINGAAMAIMILLAHRHDGLPLAVGVTVVLGLFTQAIPSSFLSDPWNPYIVILPFGAAMFCVWATANGTRWAFPAACGIGTFCVQTHVGYALPVAALLLYATGAQLLRVGRRDGHWSVRAAARALAGGVTVLAVMWILPLIQQLTNSPGNIKSLTHYFLHPNQPVQSMSTALKIVSAQFAIDPDWIVHLRPFNPFSGEPAGVYSHPVPVLAVPVVLAMAYAWWRGSRGQRSFATMLAITGGAGLIAISRIIGQAYEYRVRWVLLFAGIAVAFAAAVGARLLTPWVRRRRRVGAAVAGITAVGLVALFVVTAAAAFEVEPNQLPTSRETAAITPAVLHWYAGGRLPLLMRSSGGRSDGFTTSIPLELERHGVHVVFPNSFNNRLRYGSWHVDHGEPMHAVLIVATDKFIDDVARLPHAHLVVYRGRIPRAERERYARRLRALLARREFLSAETQQLNRTLAGTAVFALPATAANRHD